MREWLRGGAPPCQGGGRGFESRLALFYYTPETALPVLRPFVSFRFKAYIKQWEGALTRAAFPFLNLFF